MGPSGLLYRRLKGLSSYICRIWVPKLTTPIIGNYEIRLKSYIDYKGGNIVGLSDNSNEAATSAFAFMLSSVFSQYKDFIACYAK